MRIKVKVLILLISGIILIVVSALSVHDNLQSNDRMIEHINHEMQDAILKLDELESRGAQTIYSLLKLSQGDITLPVDTNYDKLTQLWVDYMNEYDVLHGIKAYLQNETHVKVIKVGNNNYLRIKLKDVERRIARFQRLTIRNGTIAINDTWYKELTIDEFEKDWVHRSKVNSQKVFVSHFYNSPLLNESVFSLYRANNDKKSRVHAISLKVSLPALVGKLSATMSKYNFVVLSDDETHVRISSKAGVLQNAKPGLKNNDLVTYFLNLTPDKNSYPARAIPFSYKGVRYVGQWSTFKFGNNTYRIAYVMQCQMANNALTYSVITLLITLICVALVIVLEQLQRKKEESEHAKIKAEAEAVEHLTEVTDKQEYIALYKKLTRYLIESKAYLKPECSLGLISESINEEREDVVKAIENHYQKSVRELVNDLRIEEATSFFDSDEYVRCSYSIDYLATRFGYNSRTTFYREFKKRTNFSPAEYQMLKSN
ncbi:helix-turn-helix transcriptional regulator [Carboxylicivirga sp. A043]|uniref:helix-turn-helix domain-containing protein n=1 Tax=Carboxylicivirga litoralis TaxID=2816963 RepID=UPI0021CAECEF|nr:AraC family transcriptional regulator [Carboxylicivirga sp. A043]MCU4156896.1 helix-turn-helix transcriptional regulator [Carboxylicivirga sp. A043]